MNLYLELTPEAGAASRLILQPGLQRIKVVVGDRFRLVDDSGATPEGIIVKRLDNHLLVGGLPDSIEIELTDFYARCGISSPCSLDLLPRDAGAVSITPGSEPVRALTDGSFVLYSASLDPVPIASNAAYDGAYPAGSGGSGGNWMIGGLALGALAIAGLASGGGGNGGDAGKLAGTPGLGTTQGPTEPINDTAVDRTPPLQPKVLSGQSASSGLVRIEGEAEAGATLTVSLDTDRNGVANLVYSTRVDADGRWAIEVGSDRPTTGSVPNGGLRDGNVAVSVIATDAASNASVAATYDLLIDSSAPGAPRIVSVYDDVPGRIGTVANGATTNDLTPTLSGTLAQPLADGERIEILRNGETIATLAAGGGTAWSFTDGGLVYGQTYDYNAVSVDALGNRSGASNSWRIVTDQSTTKTAAISGAVDNVPQKTGTIANGGVTNDKTPTINGKLSAALDANESLQVYRDGQATTLKPAVSGTSFSFTDTALADGAHSYTVRVVDAEGNGPMSASFGLVVDTVNTKTASIAAITDNASPGLGTVPNNGATNDTTPTLSGKLSAALAAGEVIEILRNDVVVKVMTNTGANWSWTDSGLVAGTTYVYSARIVDAAGNIGAESTDYSIRVSLTGKDIAGASLDDGTGFDASIAVGLDDLALTGDALFDPAGDSMNGAMTGMTSTNTHAAMPSLDPLLETQFA